MTLFERVSSMVNDVRSQSHEAPRRRNCLRMMPPCSSVQSQACFKKSSRLRSDFLMPRSARRATTFASVAIEAWSVPGTQQAFLPSIRARLTRMSWIVSLSMCPMCNTPVTLGGGITTVYGFRPSGLELNSLCSIQYLYHLLSTFSELYLLANSMLIESMLYLLFLLLYV